MDALRTTQFAAECGYHGDSPAMLRAFEDIRQSGIREARKAHLERRAVARQFLTKPTLFDAAIYPSVDIEDAIRDARKFIALVRNQPTHHRQREARRVEAAKQRILFARYVRRFIETVKAKEAA